MADYIYTMEIRLTPDQLKGVNLVQDIARTTGITLYLTGGAIRDIISGFTIRDLDFTVQGNPLKLQKDFERAGAQIAGHDEDVQGEPFVGRAGKLLTDMIKAMGLQREEVYIANVVKCRPPENRLPEKDEITTCSPFLMRQIDAIKPKVICTLGSCSAQTLLQTALGISKLRGEWFDFRGTKLMPTYHPAYLLRNPAAKPEVWKDLQKVMAVLGLQPKKR